MKNSHSHESVYCFSAYTAVIDKDMTVLQNFGETYPASNDADQAINIKAEEVSDADEEEPMPITFLEVKAEPEVSCMSVFELLDRYHTYAKMPVVFLLPLCQ
jgi:hypothetical protein